MEKQRGERKLAALKHYTYGGFLRLPARKFLDFFCYFFVAMTKK
jgi:hypothetical protein